MQSVVGRGVYRKLRMFYVTVIPINNTDLGGDDTFDFGGDFVLAPLPEWVKKDTQLDDVNRYDRDAVREATHGLVSRYEAAALGDPDPEWRGSEPRSIQVRKYEEGVMV